MTDAQPGLDVPTRAARRAGRREYGAFFAALALLGLHVVDDNYVQPEPGTSPLDHLASGLVPLVVLVLIALAYRRLRAGVRPGDVPGSEHTGGLEAQPEVYERRVVDFFDRALLVG